MAPYLFLVEGNIAALAYRGLIGPCRPGLGRPDQTWDTGHHWGHPREAPV